MTLASIDQVTTATTRPEKTRALPTPVLPSPALGAYAGWSTPDVLHDLLCRALPGRIALVSFFGSESAVLLLEAQGYRPLGCPPLRSP